MREEGDTNSFVSKEAKAGSAPLVTSNPIALGHASELGVTWMRDRAGHVVLSLPDGDIAFCISADEAKSVLRVGAKIGGAWDVWAHVDTAAISGGAALDMALAVTELRLELRLENQVLFSMDRPATLGGTLHLNLIGAFKTPTLGLNAVRAAAMDLLVRPAIADCGLGKTTQHDLIYDIGLHVGQDTDFYLKKGFRVVAVEANPMLARLAADRFEKAIAANRLTIVDVGLGGVVGQFPFYVNNHHSEWSSFDRDVASRGDPVEEVMVPTITVGTLLAAFGVPHFMKIDIEAYDRFVIEGLRGRSVIPAFLSIENGPMGQFELLVTLGYRHFKLVEQSALRGTKAPIPAREGASVEHVFPSGSSGPFGAEAPGEWLEVAKMRDTLMRHHASPIPAFSWFDLLASRG